MPSNIDALEGSWLGKSYNDYILPVLERANIPRFQERLIPFDADINESVDGIDLAVLDYRLWYCSDDTFFRYIKSISARKFRAVSIFENPYGWERPRNVDLYAFEKKLSQRTETACKILRAESPKTKIISPAIRVLDENLQRKYLNYFLHHRNLFDVYAIHCCTEVNDHSIGALATFLYQVVKVLAKPVWVTRWSVPACDHKITSTSLMESTRWEQISSIEASVKLGTMYKALNEVSRDEIRWHFAGTGQDIYNPTVSPPDIWNVNRMYLSNESSCLWMPEHFIGGVDHTGKVKQAIINAFLEIALSNDS